MASGGRAKPAPAPEAKRVAYRAADDPVALTTRPLKPRPRLLAILSIMFAAWMAFLVVLYFTTISPRRSVAPDDSLSRAVMAPITAYSNS